MRGTGNGMRVGRGSQSGLSAALGAALLTLALVGCDPFAGRSADDPADGPTPVDLQPMDPAAVAAAPNTPVDPSWLCRPGEVDPPEPAGEEAAGTLVPSAVTADGNLLEVTGYLHLAPEDSYAGFSPVGVLVPADPENRGAVAPGFTGELGVKGAPVPPIVVRERVELAGEGAPPATGIARLTLGTCDDSPMPDGQYLLQLSGGAPSGTAEEGGTAQWSATEEVLVDVVDGTLEVVPGAVTAPSGEVPMNLSPLHCGATLAAQGPEGALAVEVTDPTTEITAATDGAEEGDETGGAVTAQVTVTSQDHGTRALFQEIVLTDPRTGAVVAGARSAGTAALQWVGTEGVTTTGHAGIGHSSCGRTALEPGTYTAHAVAATLDAEGTTAIALSEPWSVEVHEDAAEA